ncbi:MAG TPA: hypothetical protein DEB06_08055 [Phycisphaerales bacterium]|nr:hypothetical protein [Phycisphaerales bacterium]
MTDPASAPPAAHDAAPPEIVELDQPCYRCGYSLRGLSAEARCPECASPIHDSLRGGLLRFSSDEHLAMLHRGVFLVLAGIIVQILAGLGGIVVGLAVAGIGISPSGLQLLAQFGGFAGTVMVLWGWWLFSTRDPGITLARDSPRARAWVRATVLVQAAFAMTGLVVQLLLARGVPTGLSFLALAAILVGIISILVTAAAFFAQMVYTRWVGGRLANARVVRRARRLMWLGPLLYTVGTLLLFLGPLIALVLYWNMLEWVRLDLKRIRRERGARCGGGG